MHTAKYRFKKAPRITKENYIDKKNYEQKFGECSLQFDSESYVFLSLSIQTYKNLNIENDSFVCCFLWVWNLVSHLRLSTETKDM
jgi:hypothetical protein